MNIVAPRTWQVGPFTVTQKPRFDNPYWAQYSVFVGKKFIGNSFSVPDIGCCEWLQRTNGVYAEQSENAKASRGYTKANKRRQAETA